MTNKHNISIPAADQQSGCGDMCLEPSTARDKTASQLKPHLPADNLLRQSIRILLSLVLAGGILWWMYRGFSWQDIKQALQHDMSWWWMAASMPFCVAAQGLRALRWKQMLRPLGERPRLRTATIAIYLSYASSLLIPRVGEVLRCAVIKRYDGVSFTRSLGTVVTERLIDMSTIGLLSLLVFVWQWQSVMLFLHETGAGLGPLLSRFTPEGWAVTIACALVTLLFAVWLLRKLAIRTRLKSVLGGLTDGLLSVKQVKHRWLLATYSLGIWLLYFLHFYVAFFAFPFTTHLSLPTAAVAFIIGTFAVLVPTPNGAGPWHFAVKTVLVLAAVSQEQAAIFVLLTHTLQTAFTALLGVYGMAILTLIKKRAYN